MQINEKLSRSYDSDRKATASSPKHLMIILIEDFILSATFEVTAPTP